MLCPPPLDSCARCRNTAGKAGVPNCASVRDEHQASTVSPKLYSVEGVQEASGGCLVRVYTGCDRLVGHPQISGWTGVALKWVWKAGVEMTPSTSRSLVWGWMHRLTPIHFRLSPGGSWYALGEIVHVLYNISCNGAKGIRLARVSETTTSKPSSVSNMLSASTQGKLWVWTRTRKI